MVLPLDAPTPRLFAERYQLQPTPTRLPEADKGLEYDCRDMLVEIGDGGTFLKIHAKAAHQEIVWWGFDFLLKKYAANHGGLPHLVVARGAQWTRDSKRDFKVVGGKMVQMPDEPEEDKNDEENGIG